jgi:hypothetical protein
LSTVGRDRTRAVGAPQRIIPLHKIAAFQPAGTRGIHGPGGRQHPLRRHRASTELASATDFQFPAPLGHGHGSTSASFLAPGGRGDSSTSAAASAGVELIAAEYRLRKRRDPGLIVQGFSRRFCGKNRAARGIASSGGVFFIFRVRCATFFCT